MTFTSFCIRCKENYSVLCTLLPRQNFNLFFIFSDEINESMNRLRNPNEFEDLQLQGNELTNSQILRLCVYLIEKKCGFNGEGIFLNSYAVEFNDEESLKMETIIYNSLRSKSASNKDTDGLALD